MKISNLRYLIILGSMYSAMAAADSPLPVEDMITDEGQVRLEAGLTYVNQDRENVEIGDSLIVQVGSNAFVEVPQELNERDSVTDTVVATLGGRYGVTPDWELYARGSYLFRQSRASGLSGISSDDANRFAEAWLGTNYRLSDDGSTPALFVFAEGAIAERHSEDDAFGRSWKAGVTTYRAIDPIVFTLTASYRWNAPRDNGGRDFDPGDTLSINPSIAFAVNDRVTLSSGVHWKSRQADRFDGEADEPRRTITDLSFGVGYGATRSATLYATAKANASGSRGAELRLEWLQSF